MLVSQQESELDGIFIGFIKVIDWSRALQVYLQSILHGEAPLPTSYPL